MNPHYVVVILKIKFANNNGLQKAFFVTYGLFSESLRRLLSLWEHMSDGKKGTRLLKNLEEELI